MGNWWGKGVSVGVIGRRGEGERKLGRKTRERKEWYRQQRKVKERR